ncbi:ribonuclease E activity regulator RraA [Rhodococcus koreensis]|uniref:ribonuclease E activity regulator RraA n=1 Tax=Rhodococcus koreensis TaxID=99653 RepID=UPI00197FE684|nr:ribonuclease E activity regulator RraA [Rhodococcus koreensis]QSE86089.1 ribonuclease E activity regulator RraA [Rhodococcus koreensis]
MPEFETTADLYDEHGESLSICTTQFRQYGGRTRFQGTLATFRGHEDNALLKTLVSEPGHGRVIVIDGDGSLHCAMLGDKAAATAARNGWEGFIVNGAIRDAAALAVINIGVKALGTNPRKSGKEGKGNQLDVPVAFGGTVFIPGARVVCDEDGVVLLPRPTAR